MFKQVCINIPLLDVIQRLSVYAKFLKDLCTIKRKNNVPQKTFLTEKVNSILLNKIPTKYKDPSSSAISCVIRDHAFDRALLDLSVIVNLLPYSIYEKLGFRDLKPAHVSL